MSHNVNNSPPSLVLVKRDVALGFPWQITAKAFGGENVIVVDQWSSKRWRRLFSILINHHHVQRRSIIMTERNLRRRQGLDVATIQTALDEKRLEARVWGDAMYISLESAINLLDHLKAGHTGY